MKNEEKLLFDEWKKDKVNFIEDGLVNEQEYSNSKKKVLYILKEVNGGKNVNKKWSLLAFLKKGGRSQTWNNISIWQFGIQTIKQSHKWSDLVKLKNKKFRISQLESIAAINLKKEPGGNTAKMNIIWDYAWNDRELLKRQIKIYNPDIIVCCGVGEIVKKFELVEKFNNWEMSKYGIEYFKTKDNKIIINYCHPEARIDSNYKYFPLIFTLQDILN